MHDLKSGVGLPEKVALVVMEEQEIYRKLYEAICSSGSPVRMIGCFPYDAEKHPDFAPVPISPDIILIGVGHLSSQVLDQIRQVQEADPDRGIVLIASYLTSGVIPAFNKFIASRRSHFAFLFRKSLNHTDQFFNMIASVKAGHVIIDPAFGTPTIKDADSGTSIAELTPREIAVRNLVARGCTNEAISATLCIDVKTVRHHINNIYSKLKTSSAFDDRHPRVSATNAYHQLTGQLVFEDLDQSRS